MALPLAGMAALSAAPGVIGGIYSYNQAKRLSPAERDAAASISQMQDYNRMLLNPNDPRYKALVEAETESVRGGFLQNLRDLIEANRRQAVMGRQEIFDPERRDESMFRGLLDASRQAQIQGRSNATNRIVQALQGLQNIQQSQLGLASLQQARQNQKNQAILGGLSGIGQGISSYSRGGF